MAPKAIDSRSWGVTPVVQLVKRGSSEQEAVPRFVDALGADGSSSELVPANAYAPTLHMQCNCIKGLWRADCRRLSDLQFGCMYPWLVIDFWEHAAGRIASHHSR